MLVPLYQPPKLGLQTCIYLLWKDSGSMGPHTSPEAFPRFIRPAARLSLHDDSHQRLHHILLLLQCLGKHRGQRVRHQLSHMVPVVSIKDLHGGV